MSAKLVAARKRHHIGYSLWGRFPARFVSPALLYLLALSFTPMAYALWLSFTNAHMARRGYSFVGVHNYQLLFASTDFRSIVGNTLIFSASSVVLQVAAGLGLALLLSQPLRGRALARSIVLTPWVISGPVVAFIFQWLFTGDRYGIVNYVLIRLGIGTIRWLGTKTTAMMTMVLAYAWKFTPFSMVLQLAALQSVPVECKEAASIDGASSWQRFWCVTFPLITPHILINMIMVTIQALGEVTVPFVLTQGGPGRATMLLSLMMWDAGFNKYLMGYASAIAAFMFLITAFFVATYLLVLRARE